MHRQARFILHLSEVVQQVLFKNYPCSSDLCRRNFPGAYPSLCLVGDEFIDVTFINKRCCSFACLADMADTELQGAFGVAFDVPRIGFDFGVTDALVYPTFNFTEPELDVAPGLGDGFCCTDGRPADVVAATCVDVGRCLCKTLAAECVFDAVYRQYFVSWELACKDHGCLDFCDGFLGVGGCQCAVVGVGGMFFWVLFQNTRAYSSM